MDALIQDMQLKKLISFDKRLRWLRLGRIYGTTKNMAKLPQIELDMYWYNYVNIHNDYCLYNWEDEY